MLPPPNHTADVLKLEEASSGYGLDEVRAGGEGEIDISLLQHSLSMTPWERMLANDDALNFARSLQAAMKRRNAKPQ